MLSKLRKSRLKTLLDISNTDEYINDFRERWTDKDVLDIIEMVKKGEI